MVETELNNGYKQYLLYQSDETLRFKIQKLAESNTNDIKNKLKTETLNYKIKRKRNRIEGIQQNIWIGY